MIPPQRGRRRRGPFLGLAIALFLVALLPAAAIAHAELETSSPADGTTVPSTFNGPVVLEFSAALADGSKAELIGPSGPVAAESNVGPAATMTITLAGPLEPGAYEVRWTSVAEDTDVARGTIAFTVEAAPEPTATPTSEPTAAASTAVPTSATPSPEPSAAPTPSPSEPGTATSSTDVLMPIVAVVLVAAAGAAYFLTRRNRPTTPR
jgi:methionine-rich copper-binding protein CopC